MKPVFMSLLFIIISYTSFSAEPVWKLEKDKDGIKVWTRKQISSNLKEYKAIATIQTSVDKLVSFLKNYKMFDKWMYKADEGSVKLVKKVNDNDFYIRMTLSAPLIKSRESITHFIFNTPDTKGAVIITLETTPDLLPLNPDYVRVPKMKGFWKLTPLENGKVEIYHQAPIVAGGSLPDAMANLGAVDAPFGMLSNLKSMLK